MIEMSRDHLAVGLDMRGYNLSSKPAGLEPYTMRYLVEDVRQIAEKIGGKNKKFVLVAHDWGANIAWTFAMYHPEMLEKLVIVNGPHPFVSERELRENPAQRYASNYFFVFNNFLAPGEKPVDENDTKESGMRRAHTGFVDATVKSGHYTEEDRQRWADAWWSMKDTALLVGNISGLDKWATNLSVKLYPNDDHWVMIEEYKEVAGDIRGFVDGNAFPKESVYRPARQ